MALSGRTRLASRKTSHTIELVVLRIALFVLQFLVIIVIFLILRQLFRSPSTGTNRPPVTPPPLAPKKLQRSPRNCRWIEQNGYTRVVLVEESFTPEAVNMRESLMQIQIDRIAEREMETLMKQRNFILEAQGMDDSDVGSFGEDCGMDLDCDSEGSEDQPVEDGSSEESYDTSNPETSYLREDTIEVEERDTVPAMIPASRRLRRLGPTGTELIDPKTFTPSSSNQGSNAVYPDSWKQALRGQRLHDLRLHFTL